MTTTATGAEPCAACGGIGAWDPGRQRLSCQSCGVEIAIAPTAAGIDHFPLLPRLADRPDNGRDWQPQPTHLRCRSCQSIVSYDAHVVGQPCDACGTPAMVRSDRTGVPIEPSGVLPFKLTEADARERLAAWLKDKASPGGPIDTIRAVYVPCWVFNARVSCRYRGEIQKKDRDGDYQRIPVDGIVEKQFENYVITAARTIDERALSKIDDFPVADMRSFDPAYTAGYTTEVYGRNMWEAWDAAYAKMEEKLNRSLGSASGCPPEELETWPEWRDQRGAHVLVPVYEIVYGRGEKRYTVVVNGWSGDLTGDFPLNMFRAVVVVTVLLAIVAGLLYGAYAALAWLFG